MSLGGKLVKVVTIFAVSALTAGTAVWYYIADNWQFGNDTAQTAKIVEKVVSDSYIKPRPLYVRFSEPVAKPILSDRPLDADIKIEPTVRGEWRWFKNTTLSFTPETVQALLLYEDRGFYYHFGVNPLSVIKDARQMIKGGRRRGVSLGCSLDASKFSGCSVEIRRNGCRRQCCSGALDK